MADVVVERYGDADRDAVARVVLAGLEEHWGSLDPELNRDVDDLGVAYADGRSWSRASTARSWASE